MCRLCKLLKEWKLLVELPLGTPLANTGYTWQHDEHCALHIAPTYALASNSGKITMHSSLGRLERAVLKWASTCQGCMGQACTWTLQDTSARPLSALRA